MAFNAGAIIGKVKLDTTSWQSGVASVSKGAGMIAVAVGAVVVGAMVKATVSANTWQKSLSNVNTLIDETQVNSQAMALSLLKLDSSLGSTKDLTDAMYQAFSAGAKDMDEALKITADSAKFATAGLTSISTAVDVLTTATNAYGKEVMSTEKASDIFFTTIKQGKITGEQLAGTIGQSIPLFASMGLSLEELGAGMATMTKQGISASESTTQLNAIVNSFLKPSSAMTEALENLGYASGGVFLEAEGLAGALKMIEETTGGSSDAISELIPNIRGMKGALALTGVGGKEFTSILEEMGNASGATETAFQKQEKTFKTYMNSAKKIELIAGNIGKSFADDIAVGATKANEAIIDFLTSAKGAETFANTVAGISSSIKLMQLYLQPMVESLMPAMDDIFGVAKDNTTEFSGSIDIVSIAFQAMSTFSGVVSSQLSMMSGLVVIATKNIVNIGQATGESGKTIVIGFNLALESIKDVGSTIKDFLSTASKSKDAIAKVFDVIRGKATWEEVKESVGEAIDSFSDFGEGVKTTVGNSAERMETFNKQLGENAKAYAEIFTGAGDAMKTYFVDQAKRQAKIFDDMKNNAEKMSKETQKTFEDQKAKFLEDYWELTLGQKNMTKERVDDETDMWAQLDALLDESVAKDKAVADAKAQAQKDAAEKIKKIWVTSYELIMEAGSAVMSGLSTIADLEAGNATDIIQLNYNKQADALDEKLASGLISEDEYDSAIEALEAETLARKNIADKKAFESSKKFKLAEIAMSTAQSIASWWSTAGQLGFPAGLIYAGVMTGASVAMGIKQAGLVNAQQFVPARKTGGMASGLTRINEQGGEIVSLPDGSQVIPNDISRQIANSNQGNNINVVINNPVVRKDSDIKMIANQVSRVLGKQLRSA